MRLSAGSSDGSLRFGARAAGAAILWGCVLLAGIAPPAAAKVFLGADEAAHLAFAGAEIERSVAYLTDAELKRARELAGTAVDSAMVTRFHARSSGQDAGTAYVDTHRVRTLTETLLVVLDPKGTIRRVEVLSFNEPEEYLPRPAWFQQFEGRGLDDELSLKAKIRPVAGATLTARAVTDASRRVLAIHHVLSERTAR